MSVRIGVLALQGDFREHIETLKAIGVEAIEVRRASELEQIDGLILPGGESTAIQKLAQAFDVFEPIRAFTASGRPVLGTCAGLILLADKIEDGIEGQETFGGLPVVVRRNAFGNQLDSFETDLAFKGITGPVHAAFIRGPIIESVSDSVEVLAQLHDGRIVAVRKGNLIGISFHPEVTGETRIHAAFAELAQASR